MASQVRVRFAPSPTGFMHLGNVRAALMNYLFARRTNGTFILRIEDTDTKRNMEEARLRILHDLEWLGLSYTEGPLVGGDYGPYLQSERSAMYEEKLHELVSIRRAYRCFCSIEELEKKRQRQIATGKPPRYDRTCLHYSDDKIKLKLAANLPFIWRFSLNEQQILELNDKAKGTIAFDMKNFSDFALSREDGTFTFMFVNFVDDWLMKITHVIRGEDHMSNTALQAALYDAFAVKMPIFWHLPIICNASGEKLSKRDFGFSLQDLKDAGFLPAAICNYLAAIGSSFTQEVQSLTELTKNFDFDKVHSASTIRYDLEKLTWFNHQWIIKQTVEELCNLVKPYLHDTFPQSSSLDHARLLELVKIIQPELKTLKDISTLLNFYFNEPLFDRSFFTQEVGKEKTEVIIATINGALEQIENHDQFLEILKTESKKNNISIKEIFSSVRYLATGNVSGIGMKDLLNLLGTDTVKNRIKLAIG